MAKDNRKGREYKPLKLVVKKCFMKVRCIDRVQKESFNISNRKAILEAKYYKNKR